MSANDFVALMLRSPLHALLGSTMLITVCGRRSGKPNTTPVNYCRRGDTLWILSSRTRNWWRNIGPRSIVQLHLQGRDLAGTAELILDQAAVAALLGEYVGALPASARPLGVRVMDGVPNEQDMARLACERLFVKVRLSDDLR